MKKILIGGIIILIVGIIFVSLFFFSARTGPIPPQIRAGWYLPQQNIVWTLSESPFNESRQELLVLSGHRDDSAPQFPVLSAYSRYENYTQPTTNHQYMIAVWYFTNERTFEEAQKKLTGFLQTSGNLVSVELNFTEHITRFERSARGIQSSQNLYTIPRYLKTSGFESGNTSGYFFTVTMPGSGVSIEDTNYTVDKEYYLVYYGTTTPANLTSQTPFLKELIAETYRYDRVIREGSLASGAELG